MNGLQQECSDRMVDQFDCKKHCSPIASRTLYLGGLLLLLHNCLEVVTHQPMAARTVLAQPPNNPAEAFEKMFDDFSKQANRFMPGAMGELTPEQLERLENVQISKADEVQYGKKVLANYLERAKAEKIEITTKGKDVEYLTELVETIRPKMTQAKRYSKIEIRVAKTDAADAYSIPGGFLIFTTGLLESAESEAAVAGVVAHELAHLDRGHQLVPLKQAKISQQPTSPQDMMMMVSMFSRPFRPEQESEADANAVVWMMECGYQPKELARLLTRWDSHQDQKSPWLKFVPGFVKSHPDPGGRAQRILEIARENQENYPDAQYIGRKNLAQRKARRSKEFPE